MTAAPPVPQPRSVPGQGAPTSPLAIPARPDTPRCVWCWPRDVRAVKGLAEQPGR